MNLSLRLLVLLPVVAATGTHAAVRPSVEDKLERDALSPRMTRAMAQFQRLPSPTCCYNSASSTGWSKMGGYFNPKQEFRRASPHHFGVFASQDISEGEMLISVPWKCILTADTDELNNDIFCDSTHYIIEETNKGNDSFYARLPGISPSGASGPLCVHLFQTRKTTPQGNYWNQSISTSTQTRHGMGFQILEETMRGK